MYESFPEDQNVSWVKLVENNLQEYLQLANICFPEWPNNAEYCMYFYNLGEESLGKFFKTTLIEEDGKLVSFGSIIVDPKIDIAYFHYTGTHPEHRRKGLFSDMARNRCNFAWDNGVKEVFVLVEENSGSHHGLMKLGFKPVATYYLYEI